MKKQSPSDILLNVFLPLMIGTLLYGTRSVFPLKGFVINQLPDACWAYAFFSCMLVIWERQISKFWICSAFLVAISFEVLQSQHVIAGTADAWDVFTYFLAILLALICNKPFKRKFLTPPIPIKTNL